MGGNLVKDSRRLLKAEYEGMCDQLLQLLLPLGKLAVPPAYKNKESFGDIDMLIASEFNSEEVVDFLSKITDEIYVQRDKSANMSSNDNLIISFGYNQVQVDLLFAPIEYFDNFLNFLSYNDLPILIGRLARRIGLKFGHRGLYYLIREGDTENVVDEVLVLEDTKLILEFLDLDYDKFIEGFDTIESMFEFIMKSKYFDSSFFQLDQLNHVNRMRNKKRPIYMKFTEHVKDIPSSTISSDRKALALDAIKALGKESMVQDRLTYLMLKNEVKKVINGTVVSQLTGLSGVSLGSFLKQFKLKYSDQYILGNKENINKIITDFYELSYI